MRLAFVLLVLSAGAGAQITAGASQSCFNNSVSGLCTASLAVNQGDAIVLIMSRAGGDPEIPVTSTCTTSGQWQNFPFTNGPINAQVSTVTNVSAGTCAITATRGSSPVSWVATAYSNVASITAPVQQYTASGSGPNCLTSAGTTTAANSVMVGFFYMQSAYSYTITAVSGSTLQISAPLSTWRLSIADTSVPSPGSATAGITSSTATNCSASRLVLTPVVQPPAGITPGTFGGCTYWSSVCSASLTVSQGDTVVVFSEQLSGATNALTSGTCSSQWTRYQVSSGAYSTIVYVAINVSGGSCTIAITTSSNRTSWAAMSYSGVAATGSPVARATPQISTSPGVGPITTTVADSVLVGFFNINGNPTVAASGTTILRGNFNTYASNATVTNTFAIGDSGQVPSPTGVTLGLSLSSAYNTASFAIELIPGTPPPPPPTGVMALFEHRTHTLSLDTPLYVLSGNLLSSLWCTNPLAMTDSAISPSGSLSLNGGSSTVELPAWQMVRTCQDSTSQYWSSVPIAADSGTGVAASGSATAIQLSLSSLLAYGQTRIGGEGIAAGGCLSVMKTAKRVEPRDMIVFSLAEDPRAIPNFAELQVRASAGKGTVRFRVCNRSGKAIRTTTFPVNWGAE